MRAFLALPIPEETVAALIAAQARIPVGRPVPEDNLHLTLAFLGEVPETVLEALDDVMAATPLPMAHVAFGGLGTFGDMDRGLVFAEVEAEPGLVALQAKVAQVARMAGAALPRRRFRPHVTITRARRQPTGPARDRLAAALGARTEIPGFDADQLVLYRSTLASGGARHDPLAYYPLSPFAA